jgi:transposase
MDGILPRKAFAVKNRIVRHMRDCRDAGLRGRYLIIVNLLHGRSPSQTAEVLSLSRSTVYRVAGRFRQWGEVGLLDGREDNGERKLDERYLATLYRVVKSKPRQHGWRRPTWTREMMVETLRKQIGVRVHVATMGRALTMINARRGRPRPTVRCPWSKRAKERRIRMIRGLLRHLPRGHVLVYEDEVDIHLNPKIGLDWMVCGQQKEVVTPGKNVKRYLAGALEAVTGRAIWVEGARKCSFLFVQLLEKLRVVYPHAKVIHVVLDNYRIHSSRIAQQAIAGFGGRIMLHFLPPYCPSENRIERLWEDLHAEVTRNHCCPNISSLMHEVREFLRRYNRKVLRSHRREAA